jgi:hypothetical protein
MDRRAMLISVGLTLAGCTHEPKPIPTPAPSASGPATGGTNPGGADAIARTVQQAMANGPVAPGTNRGTVQVGSHKLVTTFDVPVTTAMEGERAVLRFGKQSLVVDFAKGQILVDDAERAKLPAGTKDVEVQFANGALSAKADGNPVLTPPASK